MVNINAPLNFRHTNTLITTKQHHSPFKSDSQVKNSAVAYNGKTCYQWRY